MYFRICFTIVFLHKSFGLELFNLKLIKTMTTQRTFFLPYLQIVEHYRQDVSQDDAALKSWDILALKSWDILALDLKSFGPSLPKFDNSKH